jgi:hypothetical protein
VLLDVLDTPLQNEQEGPSGVPDAEVRASGGGRTVGDADAPDELLLLGPLERAPALLAELGPADGRVHQVEVDVAARGVLDRVLDRLDRLVVRRRLAQLGRVKDLRPGDVVLLAETLDRLLAGILVLVPCGNRRRDGSGWVSSEALEGGCGESSPT